MSALLLLVQGYVPCDADVKVHYVGDRSQHFSVPSHQLDVFRFSPIPKPRMISDKFVGLGLIFVLFSTSSVFGWHFNLTQCQNSLSTLNETEGYGTVDINGQLTNVNPVGYTYSRCLEECGPGFGPVDLVDFFKLVGLWLLPYLILLAQLPLHTDTILQDVRVVLYTLGSPTLALYSLCITVLNWRWLGELRRTLLGPDMDNGRHTRDTLWEILGRSQQFPVAIDNRDQLIEALLYRENDGWWETLRTDLRSKGRCIDVPASTQLVLATIAYIIACVVGLTSIGGTTLRLDFAHVDISNASGFAFSNLFCWLLPLVWGWFIVTTQCGRYGSQSALGPIKNGADDMAIFRVRDVRIQNASSKHMLSGDEYRLGSFYNYARIGTWSYLAGNVMRAYREVQEIHRRVHPAIPTEGQNIPNVPQREVGILDKDKKKISNILGEHRFGFMKKDQNECLSRAIKAFIFAFILQGVSGWSAFLIAWATPNTGLGCHALSILLYNIFSLVSCFLLITAAYLSDWRSWKIEKSLATANQPAANPPAANPPATTPPAATVTDDTAPTTHETTPLVPPTPGDIETGVAMKFNGLDRAERIARTSGKSLAVFNSLLVLLSCCLDFVGVYSNCFCASNRLSLGAKAYMVFLSPEVAQQVAMVKWGLACGMVAAPFFVFIVALLFLKGDLPTYSK